MRNPITAFRYFIDFIKNKQFYFLFTAFKFIFTKKTNPIDKIIKTTTGTFLCRKNTLDFLFANHAYEWNVKKFILRNYKNYSVFLDIGSNIGTYSILLGRKGLRCFAFEPSKENFNALSKNIELNNLQEKVKIFNYGLGETNCEKEFVFNSLNTGASYVTSTPEQNKSYNIIIKTFDSVYEDFNFRKDDKFLIKTDVEGMEPEVLEGAKSFLSKFSEILCIAEDKHCGNKRLINQLTQIMNPCFKRIDKYNMCFKKS
ncbi:MAG: FkbM family methyltransferase [Bacteroidales bacterium]|nr:FkbM family methyltransferase [Bacteroidales bacterium]